MPIWSRSSAVPLSVGATLFLTFALWVYGDTYRPSATFPKKSDVVSISPSGTFPSVRSVVECTRKCSSQSNHCQAIIYHQKIKHCRTFTKRFKRSTDVTPSQMTIYLEKYPPLPCQVVAYK